MKVNEVKFQPAVPTQSAWNDRSKVDTIIQGLRSTITDSSSVPQAAAAEPPRTPRDQMVPAALARNEAVYDFGTPSSTVSESPQDIAKLHLKNRHRYLDVDRRINQVQFKPK